MKPTGLDLRVFYRRFETLFQRLTEQDFKWQPGEKGKYVNGYIRMCEALEVRDESRIDEMVDTYMQLLESQLRAWWSWPKATRSNLIGFVTNADQVRIFAGKKRKPMLTPTALEMGSIGTSTQADWDI